MRFHTKISFFLNENTFIHFISFISIQTCYRRRRFSISKRSLQTLQFFQYNFINICQATKITTEWKGLVDLFSLSPFTWKTKVFRFKKITSSPVISPTQPWYTSVKLPKSLRKTSLSIWCPSASQRRQLSGENSSAKIILPSLSKPNSNLKSIKRRPILCKPIF